ncbi:MAG: hypothetical protein HFG28_09475 [Eubacterium sp.]|nr:hypothetical protein [Eubacterium sp.]
MDVPMSLVELIGSLSRILEIKLFTNDKRMINQIKNLKQFFNNEHGENFAFNDIRQYFEARKDMIQDIIAKKLQENEHFFQDDYHRLNYIIVCIKNDYINKIIIAEKQRQKEFQEKVVKPTMVEMTDDEFLAMIQEQDTANNFSESDSKLTESEQEKEEKTNNAVETKTENENLFNENNKKLDAEVVETIKRIVSEEIRNQISEIETRLLNKVSDVRMASYVEVKETQVSKGKSKRKNRQNIPKDSGLKVCSYCSGEKGKNHFYKSNSRFHIFNDGFILICKECLERIYDTLVSEFKECIRKRMILPNDEFFVERKAIEYVCGVTDIFYSDEVFNAALKHSSNNGMIASYMKISNLTQYRKKTYEDSCKEKLKQEILEMKEEQAIDLSWMEDAM